MPIKFRCAYCSQLMSIARRKAGSVVVCPACQCQLIVPNALPTPSPDPSPAAPKPIVFERQDFDPAIFEPRPAQANAGPASPPVMIAGSMPSPQPLPTSMPAIGAQKGVLVSESTHKKWLLLILGGMLLTALGFAAGFAAARLM